MSTKIMWKAISMLSSRNDYGNNAGTAPCFAKRDWSGAPEYSYDFV